MHRWTAVIFCVLVVATSSSCRHHGAPSPTPTSITVTSSGPRLFLGAGETFTATLTLSDGTTQSVTAGAWSTDAASIATVDAASGLVTGRASGMVTVAVDASGLRGTKAIRVLPNYGGTWQGPFAIGNCSARGTLAFTCEDLDDSFPRQVNFTLIQTADTVNGTVAFGFLSAPMTATVAADGTLSFAATTPIAVTKQYTGTWQLNSTAAGAISGTVIFTGTDSASAGNTLTFDGIVSATRF